MRWVSVILAILLFSLTLKSAIGYTLFFNDTFNRANSHTVGNSDYPGEAWTESETTKDSQILSNKLNLPYVANGGSDYLYTNFTDTTNDNITIEFNLTLHTAISGGDEKMDIFVGHAYNNFGAQLVLRNNGYFCAGAYPYTCFLPSVTGATYNVKITDINHSSDTHNIIINNTKYGAYNFQSPSNSLKFVTVQTGGGFSGGNISIDWLMIYNGTPETAPPPPATMIIENITASSITNESVIIRWNTAPAGNSTVNYNTTEQLGIIVTNTTSVLNHSLYVANLETETLYYYNVTSCADACNESGTYNFTTLATEVSAINRSYPEVNITPLSGSVTFNDWQLVDTEITETQNHSGFFDFNNKLLAYWNFESYNTTHVFDNSTKKLPLFFDGNDNVSNIVTGRYGNGYLGANNAGTIKTVVNPNITYSNQFTIMAWFNRQSQGGGVGKGRIFDRDQSFTLYPEGSPGIIFKFQINKVGGGIADVYPTKDIGIVDNKWYLVTATYDGVNLRVFVNDTLVGNRSETANISMDTNPIFIGSNTYNAYFDGYIDEAKIFQRNISLEEIRANINHFSPLMNNFSNLEDGSYNISAYVIDQDGSLTIEQTDFEVYNFFFENRTENVLNDTGAVSWNSNKLSNTTIKYGTSINLGSFAVNASNVKHHSLSLTPLIPDTLYYYNISSCAKYCREDSLYSFTTLTTPIPRANLNCYLDESPTIEDKIGFFCQIENEFLNNYKCRTDVFYGSTLISTSPDIQYIPEIGKVDYFESKPNNSFNQIVNLYLDAQDLRDNKTLDLFVSCASTNNKLNYTTSITPQYKELTQTFDVFIWMRNNASLFVAFFIMAILGTLALFYIVRELRDK